MGVKHVTMCMVVVTATAQADSFLAGNVTLRIPKPLTLDKDSTPLVIIADGGDGGVMLNVSDVPAEQTLETAKKRYSNRGISGAWKSSDSTVGKVRAAHAALTLPAGSVDLYAVPTCFGTLMVAVTFGDGMTAAGKIAAGTMLKSLTINEKAPHLFVVPAAADAYAALDATAKKAADGFTRAACAGKPAALTPFVAAAAALDRQYDFEIVDKSYKLVRITVRAIAE